jgi:hypothetical protein
MRIFSSKVLGSDNRLARVMFFKMAAIPIDGPVWAASSRLVVSVQFDIDPDGANDDVDRETDKTDDTDVQSEKRSLWGGVGNEGKGIWANLASLSSGSCMALTVKTLLQHSATRSK